MMTMLNLGNPDHVGGRRSCRNRSTQSRTTSTPSLLLLKPLHLVLLLLMLLQSGAVYSAGIASKRNESLEYCVVLEEGNEVFREIGSVWVSSENPCDIHSCEVGNSGQPQEKISTKDCGQFYCEVDSEIHPQAGTCCGVCVRNKCLFNETVYEVGQTWHNNKDCTLLECIRLPSGLPAINAYKKKCPSLPPDCAGENSIEIDCCAVCKSALTARGGAHAQPEPDLWTEQFYRNHPCVRDCRSDEAPMSCHYTFVVEWYETLSKACYACPQNASDCRRPHCIVGDGIRRSITVVNRMMPGPAIEVCQNDLLVIDVKNQMLGESTTIHWHGMHQRDTPYMDGVPHISQCPIHPHSTFRYTFRAENSGTHFWHSHTGMQRGDGVFGALIVRRPQTLDPHGHLYDFDLPEHKMLVQDWAHVPGVMMFASHHHSRGDNKPMNLLLNGKGRYYKAIWAAIKKEERNTKQQRTAEAFKRKPPAGEASTSTPPESSSRSPPDDDDVVLHVLHVADKSGLKDMRSHNTNEVPSIPRRRPPSDNNETVKNTDGTYTRPKRPDPFLSVAANTSIPEQSDPWPTNSSQSERSKRDTSGADSDSANVPLHQIPLHTFNVSHGFRYRFRIINAEFLNCPITVAVDNHSLTAISSDGFDFEAVEVGSIVTYSGERFDFVIHANQTPGNYWIRLKGLVDCDERFTSAFQVGVLHYEGSAAGLEEPGGELSYQHQPQGVELNVLNRGSGHVDSLTVAEVKALPQYDSAPGVDRDALKPLADYKFFVYYDFYAKNNPVFHPADYYGFNDTVDAPNRLFTPQLNHISLEFPAVALLPSRHELDDSMFCNETTLAAAGIDCRQEFCKCHHVLQVPLNSVVEFIIVDEGFTFEANHPFHLHGNAFRVVGLERLGKNVTIELVKQLDSYNLLRRNLVSAPVKDTVTVPDGGYTIVRFKAYNPGFWLFHCHIEFHAEIGMALVLKVGDNNQMLPVPKNFPTCNDYVPGMTADEDDSPPPMDGGQGGAECTSGSVQTSGTSGFGDLSAKIHHQNMSQMWWLLLLLLATSASMYY